MTLSLEEIETRTSEMGRRVRWIGASNPRIAALKPLRNQIKMVEPWPELKNAKKLRLEGAISALILNGTAFGNRTVQRARGPVSQSRAPEGFSVHIDENGWAKVTFAETSDFVTWLTRQVARNAYTGERAGWPHWAMVGQGALALGARASVSPLELPRPYEDISLVPSQVVMHVAPLNEEFAALLPQE